MFRRALTLAFILALAGTAFSQEAQEESEPDFYAAEERLRELVLEALRNNPGVQEMNARYRSALERAPQVRTLPDPTFTFGQFLRRVETRVGPQINTFAFTQAFPWFGKLDLREQVADQDALAALELMRARQREVIYQVKRAFYELGYVDSALRLIEEERSLLEHYETLARARYASGQGLQQSVIKLQAEISQVANRRESLRLQRRSLEARVDQLLSRSSSGATSPGSLPVAPEGPRGLIEEVRLAPEPERSLDVEELTRFGEENRQELKAASERIEKSEKAISLAKKSSWPDFVLGVGFIHVGERTDPAGIMAPPPDNGKNAVSFSAGISLPLWRDKIDSSVEEASEMLLAERFNYQSLRDEMEFSIRDQSLRVETLQDQLRLFEQVLIPQAEEALRSTEAAYETGQLGVLDLLDGERILLGVRLTRARYESDRLSALAAIERAIGVRFPR